MLLWLQNDLDPGGSLGAAGGGGNTELFLDKVRQSNEAIKCGHYDQAVQLYTEAITLDPNNYILYSNRSAAHMKRGKPALALKDARMARQLNTSWAKVCTSHNTQSKKSLDNMF